MARGGDAGRSLSEKRITVPGFKSLRHNAKTRGRVCGII
jgi:hypothetical protein